MTRIRISRKVKIIRAFQASEPTNSDLCGSCCSVSVVLGVWQVGVGHLWLDHGLHSVALHVVHRQVGGSHTEAHGVGDVVDSLDDAVGVNVAVAAPGDTISSLLLLLDGVGVAVAIVVLTEVVLSMVLGVGHVDGGCSSNNRGGNWSCNWCRSSSWDRVAVVGGVRQVGIADFWGDDWSSSSNRSRSSSCDSLNRSSCFDRSINMVDWEVCCSHTEPESIGDVVDVLNNAVRVNIAVSSTDDAVSSLDLLLHGASVVVSKAVLPGIVLGVVLASLHSSWCDVDRGSSIGHWCSCLDNRSSVDNRGRSRVGDGNNRPAWSCLDDRGGRGVVGGVLGVGQVGVLDLRGNDIASVVGRHCSRHNRSSSSDRGDSRCRCCLHRSSIHMVNWKVGGSDTEAHGIRDVVHGLDNAVGIDVAVTSPGDTVSSLHLLLCLCGVGKTVVVLAEVVLGMELRVGSIDGGWCGDYCRCCCLNNSRCSSNSVCGGQVVAIVGGIGKVGVADLRCNNRSGSSSVGSLYNRCSSRSSNWSSSNWSSSNWSSSRGINDV